MFAYNGVIPFAEVPTMHRLAIAAAALVFFLNPGFGCSADDPDFQYGEVEMKSAVEGTWVLTLGEATSPSKEEITLRVTQSSKDPSKGAQAQHRTGLIRSAAACENRTFVASAHACDNYSQMPLDVALVGGPDSYKDVRLSGALLVGSLVFTRGTFSLSMGSVSISAEIAPDGNVQSVHGIRNEGGVVPVVSLVRTSTSTNP
jgi:hypothetical protein